MAESERKVIAFGEHTVARRRLEGLVDDGVITAEQMRRATYVTSSTSSPRHLMGLSGPDTHFVYVYGYERLPEDLLRYAAMLQDRGAELTVATQ